MDSFFLNITWFGSLYLLIPLSALVCILLFRIGRYDLAILLNVGFFITVIVVHGAKIVFRRPRPTPTELLVAMPPDWSFPSAHMAQATAFFLLLTCIAFQILPPLAATLVAFFSLVLVVCVGYSRVYLQVHYISDVLAGMLLAILLISVVQVIFPHLNWFRGK